MSQPHDDAVALAEVHSRAHDERVLVGGGRTLIELGPVRDAPSGRGVEQDDRRVGIAMNYCAGWIRQQENQQLGIPRDVAAGFSRRLRQLCGYGVYNGLMGHIDKHSPAEMLGEPPAEDQMVWDAV